MNAVPPPFAHCETFAVPSSETAGNGRIDALALCGRIQEAAAIHAEKLHIGWKDLRERGLMWVLCRFAMEAAEYPAAGGSVSVFTWPSQAERIQCRRDFVWRGEDGRTLGRAATFWIIASLETRRIERLPGFVAACFPPEPCHALAYPAGKLPVLQEAGESGEAFEVRAADIDRNDHVNNLRFVEWAMERVPPNVRATRQLAALVTDFRSEAFQGDTLVSRILPAGEDGAYYHGVFREDDGRELARLKTVWR